MKEKYFEFLEKEIENSSAKGEVKSIYFGGGTPSCVDEKFIVKILEKIKSKFKVKNDAEITIECNPNSTTFEKLNAYKNAGVNRLSFGVQSLDDDKLKMLGRLHNKTQAEECVKLAKKVGIQNISVDFLIGIPNETKEDIFEEIEFIKRNNIPHISAYMLQIEEKTPLFNGVKSGNINVIDDDKCVELYELLSDKLEEVGLHRYEISNFAKTGCESHHNQTYWKRENYIGFGLSAHSFIDGKRFANPSTFEDYFSGKNLFVENLSKEEEIEEIIMLGLRCNLGVKFGELLSRNYDIKNNKNFQKFVAQKIITADENKFYLNPKFYGVSNNVICSLLP